MAELDRALHYLVSTSTIGLTYHKTGTTTPKLIGPLAPRPLGLTVPAATTAATVTATTATATAATAAPTCCTAMALLRVLAFDHEGRPVQFDTWLDDLQLYLLSDSKDSVPLFDLAPGAAPAPPATADSATHSQWLTRDAAARLAIRNHLTSAECAHFGQHRTAQALYAALAARYSSPATTALGRLLLPYLFPELSAFATVEDLVSHLCTSDARYHATVLAEFLDRNQPPMFITLYFIVTRLSDSLCSVSDHFLSLDPTSLTIDLLEQHLLAAETSAIAVGAARGTPRPPFFEGCSPSPLAPSYASDAAADVIDAEDVGAASASGKGKGSKGGGGGSGSGGWGSSGGGGGSGGGGSGGSGGGGGGVVGGGGGSSGSGGSGGGGTGARRGGPGGGQRQQQQHRSETQSPQQLREWLVQRGTKLHTQHRCFSRLDDAWCAEFGDDVELPRWADLLRSRIAIVDLDFDAILSAMYALSVSAEGDCYRCVPPDPGIAAAALGASESGTLPGTAPAEALHTFTLDSGASRCFFCDSTTLTPLPAPIPVKLADPSGGPVVARSSTALPCSAYSCPPGESAVSICTCTWTGRHLDTITRPPGSSMYTMATEPPQVAASAQVSASGQVGFSYSCRFLSHQTLLWHHRLGHPSLPRLCGMHSRLLVCGLLRSLPPLPPSPAPPCLPCVEGRQRAAPHSSSFTPMTAPLQNLQMDRDFCRGEFILQSFTLLDSPQQNGIAERCIGLVMEVARTSMIHADAPHFLWSFAVRYAAHQLNLWPRVSLPETSLTLRWTGEVGDASVFRVWGSRAFVSDMSADKLSAHAIPCVFLGFVPDAPGWQFYHPTSPCVIPSQDVTFDESVPFYRLFPYRSAPPPPPPLFLAPGPPPVDSLPPQGPAPSGVSQVDPLPGSAPVEVGVGSCAAPGAASGGDASGGAEPGGAGSECAGSGGAEPGGEEPGGAKPEGVEPGGAESEGAESRGAEPRGAASSGGPAGASPRLSPHQLREWLVWRARLRSGAPRAGGAGDAGAGGAGVTAGAGGPGGTAAAGPGGARTRVTGAAGTGSCVGGAGAGAGGAGVGGTGAGGTGAAGAGAVDPGAGGAGGTSGGLIERREPASRLVSPVRTARRTPHSRPPPVPGTHAMALRSSSVPLHVPLPTPHESSLPKVPSFESAATSALVAELLEFAAACRLDYATALVAESVSASPPSVGGECALGTDVLEDFECLGASVPRFASMLLAPEGDPDAPDISTPRSCAEAITTPYSSQWQAAMDAGMASWKSTGTYVDEVPPRGANIVAFKARYIARGFSQRQGFDYFQTFSHTPKMTTLWSFPAGTQWGLRRPVYGLRQAPCEWHDTLRTTLAALGFAPATADLSLILRTDTSLPRFYVLVYVEDLVFATADTEVLTLVKSELQKRHTCTDLSELHSYLGLQITRDRARCTIALTQSHMAHPVLQPFGFQFSSPQPTPLSTSHSLSAPPSDESVEPSGPYPELVSCLMYLMTCTRPDLAYPLSLLARYVAPGRHRKVHWDAAKRVLRYLCSLSGMGLELGGRGPVILTGHAYASWFDDSAMQRWSQG
ncbi:unnamed protein product [Closterium sp. NIES-54]